MYFRSCCYRGCSNRPGRKQDKLVLFKFPKEPTRREKWLKFGGVSLFRQSLQKDMFMCSVHFDKRYISVNSRRTCLVGDSVPYPYNEKTECDDKDYEEIFVKHSKEKSTHEKISEIKLDVQCLENEQNAKSLEINFSDDDETKNIIIEEEFAETDVKKDQDNFKEYENISEYAVCTISDTEEYDADNADEETIIYKNKLLKIPSTEFEEKNEKIKCYNNKTAEDSSDGATIPVDMKTFILYGEEYIQMPKANYMREKNELLKTIQKYEQLFESIQERINIFNDLK